MQLYSYCPEAPNARVKYVAHRASCCQETFEDRFLISSAKVKILYGQFSQLTRQPKTCDLNLSQPFFYGVANG